MSASEARSAYLRKLGAGFAKAHPKIASRLRLGPDVSEDPHVERLIQAFATFPSRKYGALMAL